MMDFKTVTEIFLDFVYSNNILPDDIVRFLEKHDSEKDFRLVCDLLFYKEKFDRESKDHYRTDFYHELTLRARSLQNVNVWRDSFSLLNLHYLAKLRNIDVHTGLNPNINTIKDLIKQLIETANMQNGNEYISKLNEDNRIKIPESNNAKFHENRLINTQGDDVENLQIGDEFDAHELNKRFHINYMTGMHFTKRIILWNPNSRFNNYEKDGILHYFGHNIANDHGGVYDQAIEKENARFYIAAEEFKNGNEATRFMIFKKKRKWVYMGQYDLIDAIYRQSDNPKDMNPNRKVFEFLLKKVEA